MNDQQKVRGLGYILVGIVILVSLMLSIKPELIFLEGSLLDISYRLPKTLFVIFTLYTLLSVGLKLIRK